MFYNKYYPNNYEELISYYPKFYREVFEMRAILEAEGSLADDMEDNIERVFDNCFIDTADEQTIENLERFLHIKLYKQRDIEERRRLVKALFVGGGKISASLISEMIEAYTGAAVYCTFEPFDQEGNNMLTIDFDRGTNPTLYMSEILELIEQRIPAHIVYRTAVVYSYPIAVGKKRTSYSYEYDLCGTKPEISTQGSIHRVDAATRGYGTSADISYALCGTRFSG